MKDIYEDGTYLSNNPTWHEEDSPWKARQIMKIIERNGLMPASVCEVGCGAGEILNQLSVMLGGDVSFTGFEISPQAFEICRRKTKHNLSFVMNDLLKEQASFDVVLAIDVIEHVEDCFGFLRGLKDKGEYKIFHIPLDLSVQGILRRGQMTKNRKNLGHIHCFTKDTALATLQDSGYTILDYFYTRSSLELPGLSWKKKLMKVPRKVLFSLSQDLTVTILGGFSLMVLAE